MKARPRRPAAKPKAPVARANAGTRTGGGADTLPDSVKAIAVVEDGARPGKGKSDAKNKVQTFLFRTSSAAEDFDLADIGKLANDDKNLAWADLEAYSEEEFKKVAALLKLHPIAVEAALAPWQRPRIDTFGDYFYLSVTIIDADLNNLKVVVGELDMIVGRNFLLSAHRQPLPFFGKVIDRVHQSGDLVRYHTAFVLFIILDEMIDYYQEQFESLEELIEKVEETALRDESDDFLENLLRLKRYVFLLGRLAEQHRQVFAAFTRPDFQFISGEEVEPYFKDLQQRLEQFVERLFAARESVNGAFDIYVSQISHRTNLTMKVLTVVSTLLLPAAVIVGFFSTTFTADVVGIHSTPAFWVMVALLVLVPGGILVALRRLGRI